MNTPEERHLESIKQIFDIGGICNSLTPCYVEWLRRILKRGIWRLSVFPFVEINERKRKGERDFITVYDCGYEEGFYGTMSFRDGRLRNGMHENLHQAVHCLNEYKGISFDKIWLEQKFDGYMVDILAENNAEERIIVELGHLSNFAKLWLIYEPKVKELWFDGISKKRRYFYSLKANGKPSKREYLDNFIPNYFERNKCEDSGQSWQCSTHSRDIYRFCHSTRSAKNFYENR